MVFTAFLAVSGGWAEWVPSVHASDENMNKGESLPIHVTNATLRPSHHIAGRAAGFFTIENTGANDLLLQGITAPLCGRVSANHSDQEPTDNKRDIFQSLAIPQHSVMVFPQAGYHIVCNDMIRSLQPGERVPFYFHFMSGAILKADFTMIKQGAADNQPQVSGP